MGSLKIYTKTGDAGETGLLGGARVPKSDSRVDAFGEVDELNAWLGLVRANRPEADLDAMLDTLQRDLFAVGALLADPRGRIAARVERAAVTAEDVARLEGWIDELEARLSPLRRFVLAGGAPAGALLHVARAVCRRAERRIVSLGTQAVDPVVLAYVNRVSDLLFVMARTINARAGAPEVEW
jgi:cob(I)alamin adenosyltransferase